VVTETFLEVVKLLLNFHKTSSHHHVLVNSRRKRRVYPHVKEEISAHQKQMGNVEVFSRYPPNFLLQIHTFFF
jgi:hypothetical protein